MKRVKIAVALFKGRGRVGLGKTLCDAFSGHSRTLWGYSGGDTPG